MACCSASGIVAVVAIYELGLPPFGDFQTEFPEGCTTNNIRIMSCCSGIVNSV